MGTFGKRGEKKKPLTEIDIQKLIRQTFTSFDACLENMNIYGWESDSLLVSKTLIVREFEIKASRADFLRDFKDKKAKHEYLQRVFASHKQDRPNSCPSRFYYIAPEGIIDRDKDLPPYAGLAVLTSYGSLKLIAEAPILHKEPLVIDHPLFRKLAFNYRFWKDRCQYLEDRDTTAEDLHRLQKENTDMARAYHLLSHQTHRMAMALKEAEQLLKENGIAFDDSAYLDMEHEETIA